MPTTQVQYVHKLLYTSVLRVHNFDQLIGGGSIILICMYDENDCTVCAASNGIFLQRGRNGPQYTLDCCNGTLETQCEHNAYTIWLTSNRL